MTTKCPLCGAEVERHKGMIPYHFAPRVRGQRGLRGCEGPNQAQVPHYPSTTTTYAAPDGRPIGV